MARQQHRVIFSGDVQGVGFRFTACRVAGDLDVVGYVRNLPDGRVECVVEGEDDQTAGFIAGLAEAMSGYIRGQVKQVAPAGGQFESFTVRY